MFGDRARSLHLQGLHTPFVKVQTIAHKETKDTNTLAYCTLELVTAVKVLWYRSLLELILDRKRVNSFRELPKQIHFRKNGVFGEIFLA